MAHMFTAAENLSCVRELTNKKKNQVSKGSELDVSIHIPQYEFSCNFVWKDLAKIFIRSGWVNPLSPWVASPVMDINSLVVRGPDLSFCHDSQEHPQTPRDFRDGQTDAFNNWLMKGPSHCPTFLCSFIISFSTFKDFLCFASSQDLWCPCSMVAVTASHRHTHSALLSLSHGSYLHCCMSEVNVCCHHLANMFCHLIPCWSSLRSQFFWASTEDFHIPYSMLISIPFSLGISTRLLDKCRIIITSYRTPVSFYKRTCSWRKGCWHVASLNLSPFSVFSNFPVSEPKSWF